MFQETHFIFKFKPNVAAMWMIFKLLQNKCERCIYFFNNNFEYKIQEVKKDEGEKAFDSISWSFIKSWFFGFNLLNTLFNGLRY